MGFQKGNKIRLGMKNSEYQKERVRFFLKGKPKSEEHKRKLSIARKGIPHPTPWLVGKKQSQEQRKKMSISHTREKNPNWKGGKGTERHRLMGQYKYVLWRSCVFERDNYTCQDCGKSGIYIMAHHIKSWTNYPQLRYDISNGITLCKKCHAKHDKHYAKFVSKEVFLS